MSSSSAPDGGWSSSGKTRSPTADGVDGSRDPVYPLISAPPTSTESPAESSRSECRSDEWRGTKAERPRRGVRSIRGCQWWHGSRIPVTAGVPRLLGSDSTVSIGRRAPAALWTHRCARFAPMHTTALLRQQHRTRRRHRPLGGHHPRGHPWHSPVVRHRRAPRHHGQPNPRPPPRRAHRRRPRPRTRDGAARTVVTGCRQTCAPFH